VIPLGFFFARVYNIDFHDSIAWKIIWDKLVEL
jgi:hypothetical protein